MRNLSTAYTGRGVTRVSLVAMLLACSPLRLAAQGAATVEEIRALRQEATELTRRLAELEKKLAAFPPETPPARDKPAAAAIVEPRAPPPGPLVPPPPRPTHTHHAAP